MTMSLPYLMEDPKKPYNVKEYYPQKTKGMSFFAFIFSIIVYISVFYIFNLSPSTLFKTSKFWFLISNTLILILAVDYGAFSSSKNKQQDHVYDEYQEIATKVNTFHEQQQQRQQEVYNLKYMQEEKEEESTKTPERKLLQIVAVEAQKEDIHVDDHKRGFVTKKIIDVHQPKTHRRSKSEKTKRVVFDETKNNIVLLKRSETNVGQENNGNNFEAMNEFATMSDEDLNRRVEEFIQRFNRQIRLQARDDIYN